VRKPCRNYPAPTKTETEKMIATKQDCSESISQYLERTAVWRRSLAVKFPDDPRNQKAAETLEKLAESAERMSEDQWVTLKPHFGVAP
jgi:hypothetical protein